MMQTESSFVCTIKKATIDSCEYNCFSFFVLLHIELCSIFMPSNIFGFNSFTYCPVNITSTYMGLCGRSKTPWVGAEGVFRCMQPALELQSCFGQE